MNLRGKMRKHTSEVPTHSLNDIMFFLLLFFLIISTLTNPNVIKILTAKAASVTPPNKKEKKSYEIQISAEKEYFYNNTKVSTEELQKLLAADAQSDPEMLVAIDIHPDVDVQAMVDILSLCKKSNAKCYLKDI